MKANYWFKVYREYADDYIKLSMSANSKKEAIAKIQKRMFELDGIKPKVKDFEFLSKNTTIISMDKKYKTRDGKRVILHEIGELKYSSPVKGAVIAREQPLKQECHIWSIHGEFDAVWCPNHKYDLIEVK